MDSGSYLKLDCKCVSYLKAVAGRWLAKIAWTDLRSCMTGYGWALCSRSAPVKSEFLSPCAQCTWTIKLYVLCYSAGLLLLNFLGDCFADEVRHLVFVIVVNEPVQALCNPQTKYWYIGLEPRFNLMKRVFLSGISGAVLRLVQIKKCASLRAHLALDRLCQLLSFWHRTEEQTKIHYIAAENPQLYRSY